MEAGAPEARPPRDGWLARGLGTRAREDPFAALAIASRLPLTLRGSGGFALGEGFGLAGAGARARRELAALYAGRGGPDPVAQAGRRALAALAEYERVGPAAPRERRAGARIAPSADEVLRLERAGLPLRAVFLESGGWDTHIHQGAESGALAVWIRDLAEGMRKLADGLRGRRDWRLVVMTEFGRTVRPNGSRGTDHGHGSLMLLAGSRLRGGVHGDWRGLAESALYEGRDLPVTTDWRSVLHEVLTAQLGRPPPRATFPGFAPQTLGLFDG